MTMTMTMTTGAASRTTRTRTLSLAGLSLLAAIALGGCNNNKTKDGVTLESLQKENQELRDRNTQVEAALSEAENKNATLQSENAALKTEPARAAGAGARDTGYTTRGSDIVISIAGDVLFSSGSATLKPGAKRELDDVISRIKSQYGGHRLEIAGHTDSDPLKKTKGKWTDNENLSAQRALAVERYLAEKGISRSLMHSSAYGADMPKGSKKDSRRVEIVILGGAT